MAKDTEAGTQADGVAETKPGSRKRQIVLGLVAVLVIAAGAGGYFAVETFAATPTAKEAAGVEPGKALVPLPVARIASAAPVRAQDYQIVSVFEDEAILATSNNLIRVKVGSLAQGLGTITSVDASGDGGGTVVGTEATLRTL